MSKGWWLRFGALMAACWRDVRRVLIPLLVIDMVLLGLFLRWAFVEHHMITSDPMFGGHRFSLEDGALIERWGYLKQAAIVGLLVLIGRRRPSMFLASLALMWTLALLDDSLRLHERLGMTLAGDAGVPRMLAEFVALGLIGAAPMLLIAIGWFRLPRPDRIDALWLLVPLGAMVGFAGVADLVHGVFMAGHSSGKTLATLIEDGGELLSMTAGVVAAAAVLSLQRAPQGRGTTSFGTAVGPAV